MKRLALILASLIAWTCAAAAAAADAWPAKPLHVIVPVPPGGGVDIVARVVAARLSAALGQPVIVENRPGARNTIGAEAVARSAPDGYTLLVTSDAYTAMPFIERKLPFDVPGSFAPVSLLATQPLVLAVHPSTPVRSVGELIALARTRPGAVAYGTGALGHYLAAEYVQKIAGFEMTHVPYKGGAPAITDLVGGQVPAALTGQSPILQQVRGGHVRALAVLGRSRSTAMPDVPTMAEAGVPGVDLFEWIFMLAPTGTPAAVVERLNGELRKVLVQPDVRSRLFAGGFEPAPSTPAQLAVMIGDALKRWGQLIPQLHIAPE